MPYINGVYFPQPGVNITINDSALIQNLSNAANGLLLLGSAVDGQPQTVYTFTSPLTAITTLKGGTLLQAVLNAFSPSTVIAGSPFISVIRVDEVGGTISGNTIPNADTGTAITLSPTSYGVSANSLSWMLGDGSINGYKFSMADDLSPVAAGVILPTLTLDNISLSGISVYYTGDGTTPTYTVTDSSIEFDAMVADTETTIATVTFTDTMTMTALVNQINLTSELTAAVTDPNPNDLVEAFFDNVASATLATTDTAPTIVTANTTAIVRAINSAGGSYFTATRTADATLPLTSDVWTFISGATTTSPTTGDYQDGYTLAQTLTNIYGVCCITNTYAVWAMNDAHCTYMQTLGLPRRGYVGDEAGQTIAQEITYAQTLNSGRTSLVWPECSGYDYNGNATTFAPYLVAPMLASMRCGGSPTRALTNTQVSVTGLAVPVTPSTVAQALVGGVDVLYANFQNQVTIAHDITTWLANTALDKVENNVGMEEDIIYNDLFTLFSTYIGLPNDSTVQSNLTSTTLDRLQYWYSQNYISVAPTASNINITYNGTSVSGTISIALTVPINYIDMVFNVTSAS